MNERDESVRRAAVRGAGCAAGWQEAERSATRSGDTKIRPRIAFFAIVLVVLGGLAFWHWEEAERAQTEIVGSGIICVLLMESLVILTAIAIVKEKERGTMEQLVVTPIRSHELILGKAIPFVGIGYMNIAVVTFVGTYWFEVSIRGSLPLLLALTGLFILTCLGLGLVASAVSNTQQQASMTGQFMILPSLFFSGFMFPIASMPPLVQKLTYLVPLRYYITIVRGLFLKGVGWDELWDEALILLVYGVVILALASAFFRRQIR